LYWTTNSRFTNGPLALISKSEVAKPGPSASVSTLVIRSLTSTSWNTRHWVVKEHFQRRGTTTARYRIISWTFSRTSNDDRMPCILYRRVPRLPPETGTDWRMASHALLVSILSSGTSAFFETRSNSNE